MHVDDHRPPDDHSSEIARAFVRAAHRRALSTVRATDSVALKRRVIHPHRPGAIRHGAGEHHNPNPELQPMHETTVTIEPSEKYRHVVGPRAHDEPAMDDVPETEEEYREQHPAPDAAEAYEETIANAPSPPDDHEYEPLTWGVLSVSSDPDLVAKMATYFKGMQPDEPVELLRAKLRLLDVNVYANAQIAARSELRTT